MLQTLFFHCVLLFLGAFHLTHATNEELSLQTYLSGIDNNIYARPVRSIIQHVQLNTTFFLEKIVRVDASEQSITVAGLLFVMWFDERLVVWQYSQFYIVQWFYIEIMFTVETFEIWRNSIYSFTCE